MTRAERRRALKDQIKELRKKIQEESGGRISRKEAKKLAKETAEIMNREGADKIALTIDISGKSAEIISSIVIDISGDQVKNTVNPPPSEDKN